MRVNQSRRKVEFGQLSPDVIWLAQQLLQKEEEEGSFFSIGSGKDPVPQNSDDKKLVSQSARLF